MVVLFVGDLHLHPGAVLQDVLVVLLQEGHLLVADDLLLGGQLDRRHDHPLPEEGVVGLLPDVVDHRLILHPLAHAGDHEGYHGAVVLEGQCEGEVLAAAAQPAVLLLASLRLRVVLLFKTSINQSDIEDMMYLSMLDPLY